MKHTAQSIADEIHSLRIPEDDFAARAAHAFFLGWISQSVRGGDLSIEAGAEVLAGLKFAHETANGRSAP